MQPDEDDRLARLRAAGDAIDALAGAQPMQEPGETPRAFIGRLLAWVVDHRTILELLRDGADEEALATLDALDERFLALLPVPSRLN